MRNFRAMPTICLEDVGEPLLDTTYRDTTLKSRPQRLPIQAPLRYRARGETAWNEGTTISICRSGVLFRTTKELQVKTVLEMQIQFPASLTGGIPVNVCCYGPVTRTEPSLTAVAILDYRFKRTTSD